MRALIQRVKVAQVYVAAQLVGRIGHGLVLFLGIGKGDGPREVHELVEKIIHLRVFENESGRLDFSLLDVRGEMLVVSQFTLYGDCSKGRRPSFSDAAPPSEALDHYNLFLKELEEKGIKVASGRFGEKMEVALVNDGPVTLWLESHSAGGYTDSRK
jgi:D-tyrosyl-tRNA(Tyr) deacylase